MLSLEPDFPRSLHVFTFLVATGNLKRRFLIAVHVELGAIVDYQYTPMTLFLFIITYNHRRDSLLEPLSRLFPASIISNPFLTPKSSTTNSSLPLHGSATHSIST